MFPSFVELPSLFIRQRHLIAILVTHQFKARYHGSFLGMLWALLNPLLLLVVYGFVFSYLFPPRWAATGNAADIPFAILLFAGIMIHQYMAESLMRAPTTILDQTNYVKKVVFPLEILVPTNIGSYLFVFAIQWLLLLITTIFITHEVHFWAFVWPFTVFIPFFLMMVGLSWILAAIGVYIRDISHMMSLIIMVMLFLSPVLYPIDVFPSIIRPLVYLNPQSFPIEQLRQLLIYGQSPDWHGTLIYAGVSLFVFWFGYVFFALFKKGFADVI